VEILVTVAISAILISLLIVGGKSVMDKSRTAQCQANLRQIASGVQSYAAENNGAIVPSRIGFGGDKYWPYLLAPYLGMPRLGTTPAGSVQNTVFYCPVKKSDATGNVQYPLGIYGVRYSINSHIAQVDDLLTFPQVSRSERLVNMRLSKTMIFMDAFQGGLGFASTISSTYPHQEKANTLFLDGHVEQKSADEIQRLKDIPYHVFWRGYDWGYGGYRED
jgi:prepilin-type processing-associated H-X9-DG protein